MSIKAFVILAILVHGTVLHAQSRPDTAWTRVVGEGEVYEQCTGIHETSDGGVITVGWVQEGPNGRFNGRFHRLGMGGSFVWSRRQFGYIESFIDASMREPTGDIVVAGDGYDPQLQSSVLFLAAINEDGDSLWMSTVPYGAPSGNCIARAADGGYAVGGCGRVVGGMWVRSVLYRFDQAGQFLWLREYPNQYEFERAPIHDIVALEDNGFIFAAYKGWSGDSGFWNGSRIIRVNEFGDTLWTRTFDSESARTELKCIEPTPDGNFLYGGYLDDNNNIWMKFGKITPDGEVLWDSVYTVSTSLAPYWEGHMMAICPDGGWVITATHSPWGGYDTAWLLRFNSIGDTLWSWTVGWPSGDNTGAAVTLLSDGGFALGADSWDYGELFRIWTLVVRTEPEETAADPFSTAFPKEFQLQSVYPNPFNATTTIEFSLARPARVRLALYDVLGRQAALIYDGWTPAGQQRFPLYAGNLASGEYFLRANNGSEFATRRITLLK